MRYSIDIMRTYWLVVASSSLEFEEIEDGVQTKIPSG